MSFQFATSKIGSMFNKVLLIASTCLVNRMMTLRCRILCKTSDGASKYPIAAAATMINFYMDDFLSGADDIEELYVLRQQMIELLRSGGFELSKWATSHPSLSKEISESDDVLMLPRRVRIPNG